MLTLWDLLPRKKKQRSAPAPAPAAVPEAPPPEVPAAKSRAVKAPTAKPVSRKPAPRQSPRAGPAPATMRERYDAMARSVLREHGIRVRKWRTSTTGCAWEVKYADGRLVRLIEAPKPRGPMSAAVFLHEVGHHAIGFHRYAPRCLEEHMAWAWSLAEMERHGLNVTDAVRKRVRDSMRYAIAKARRRGIKRLPAELAVYLTPREQALLLAGPVDGGPPRRPRRRRAA